MQDISPKLVRPVPKLNTGHCVLRLPEPAESPAVVAFLKKNRDHLANAGPAWPDDYLTEAYWVNQLTTNLLEFEEERSVRFFIFERSNPEAVVGYANISNIVKGAFHAGILGYGIDKDKEGRSMMKEALQSVITYGFSALNLHRIMANYQPVNERSGGLLRSLGFTVEGYARDYLLINGRWRDHVLTSITNPNWMP
ncbi:MAG TPA: GNAT family N-acetyltransferase [Candidatus Obscuribacter sp.]|nr:GNAT family N-acetyltransferase [Candidatus Obscuribacter sp.]HMY51542.1 GNAT family N-acetyltransferase [Candidatus Obscuribacter sp.]HNA72560.1 GNAT family N-acetyltransferase [Candidatus Obscuribacter sp.]HNB15236.1 GNAT family N-acetyltransferase [Candidatus Obscuribacter sp.]HND06174.1 GNAT family N-acetyltransferase [Candidatus Obscuribacter sp.]